MENKTNNNQTKNVVSKVKNSIKSSENQAVLKWGKRSLVCATLLGVCALVLIAIQLLNVLGTPVAIVIWTMIFVFLLKGIVNKLDKKGVNRVLGTAIAYVVMVLVVAIVGLFMFSPMFGFSDQVINMIENIPQYIEALKQWATDLYGQYGHFLQTPEVQKGITDAMNSIGNIGGQIASAGANGIIAAGGVIGNSFMAFGFSLVVAFWVLIELPALGKEAKRFIKPKYKEDADMWKVAFTHVMAGYIKGTFLQCFIIGVCAGLLFWILGIDNPGALGCITGVLNIIPIFGPWIGGACAAIGGLFINVWIAIIALVGTICIQQFVYTFISPKIMSDSCNIHPALSLLALLAGGAIGGAMSGVIGSLVGMLLSIPFVAVFKSLFIYYYEKHTGIRIVSTHGVFFKGIPLSETEANPMADALSMKTKKKKDKNNENLLDDAKGNVADNIAGKNVYDKENKKENNKIDNKETSSKNTSAVDNKEDKK